MECNKDEAIRAKVLAEKKFRDQDYDGARRLVSKAVRLNASIEGLSQMLPIIDVHLVSQQTLQDGEMDWYGILKLEPLASVAAVKSRYKKLALLFHPDKSKAVGAESAFKLINDAWSVLADKSAKLQYDSKRRSYAESNARTADKVDTNSKIKSDTTNKEKRSETGARTRAEEQRMGQAEKKLATEEAVENKMKRKTEEKETKKRARDQKQKRRKLKSRKGEELKAERESKEMSASKVLEGDQRTPEGAPGDPLKEGSRQIFQAGELNQLAQLKRRMFQREARETRAQRRQAAVSVVEADSRRQQIQELNLSCHDEQVQEDAQPEQISAGLYTDHTGQRKISNEIEGDPNEEKCYRGQRTKLANPAAHSLRSTGQEERNDKDERPLVISREMLSPIDPFGDFSHEHPYVPEVKETLILPEHPILPEEVTDLEEKRSLDGEINGSGGSDHKPAKVEQDSEHEQISSLNGTHEYTTPSANPTNQGEKSGLGAEIFSNDFEFEIKKATVEVSSRMTRSMLREKRKQVSKEGERDVPHLDQAQEPMFPTRAYVNASAAGLQILDGELLEVLPSQFCAFDDTRTRQAFRAGQIWAAYDDTDGMPRFYCRLTRVSRSPFRVKLSWLEPTSSTQKEHYHFWGEGSSLAVSIGCGEFKTGEDAVSKYINIFSHCVSQNSKGDSVKIYPLKAETWAIYVDWNQKLKTKREAAAQDEDIKQCYELVEIVEDYSEDQGVATVKLIKVPGYRSVFHRQEGPGAMQCFSPSQLPAFSHRIPNGKVPANVQHGIYADAWELDPASLPESMMLCSTT